MLSFWDFSSIKRITPAVALVIASEYDRVRRKNGWLPRAVDLEKWDPGVRAMLLGVGFFELTGVHRPNGAAFIGGETWSMLRFRCGDTTDGEQVEHLLSELGLAEAVENPELYEAIVEALVNTKHHAYPTTHEFPEPHVPGWWLTGFVDRKSRRLRISFFDQGLTIPGTLQAWDRYSKFRRNWYRLVGKEPDPDDTSRDGAAIALAMAVGRTSTGEGYRGKGLPAIEEAVNLSKEGRLAIFSRCGEYRRSKGGKPHHVDRNVPIGGTLIIWDMQF